MADKATTTKETPPSERIAAAVNDLRDVLLDSGMPEGEVDAKLWAIYPNQTNLVGNFADLQRAGGQVASGTASSFAEGVVIPATTDVDTGETTPATPATEATTTKK